MSRLLGIGIAFGIWVSCVALLWAGADGTDAEQPGDAPAQLEVVTRPEGAAVRVEWPHWRGVYVRGTTPCSLSIPLGDRAGSTCTVHIEKAGYQSVARELVPEPGVTESVAVELEPIAGWAHPSRPREAHPVTIAAVGDVRLGEVRDPFGAVSARLMNADVTFGNLEAPLTSHPHHTPAKSDAAIANYDEFVFRAHPRWANALAMAGFDIVSLANNHMMDYRQEGLAETIATLKAKGIKHVGAGADAAEAQSLRVIVVGGVRVGFLAATSIAPPGYGAQQARPGVATQRVGDLDRWLADAVAAASRKVDILCVSFHWGIERREEPADYQRRLARACVAAGADFVIGHHPHCLQPVEVVNGALVAYSLGNFVGLGTDDLTRRSQIITACFSGGRLAWYELAPVRIVDNRPLLDGPARRVLPAQRSPNATAGSMAD